MANMYDSNIDLILMDDIMQLAAMYIMADAYASRTMVKNYGSKPIRKDSSYFERKLVGEWYFQYGEIMREHFAMLYKQRFPAYKGKDALTGKVWGSSLKRICEHFKQNTFNHYEEGLIDLGALLQHIGSMSYKFATDANNTANGQE